MCTQSCPTLCDPMDCQAPLSMGFSREWYWSGLSFPLPGNLPDPRIKPESPATPALAGGFFTTELPCCCCCLVPKPCLTLCNPMDCSMPCFPIFHYLQVCSNSCPLNRWCHPAISSSAALFSSCPQSFPASGFFPMSRLFTSGGQIIGASASASVLSMNIQGWFPLGLAGLISLQSKGLSRVFSNTTVWKQTVVFSLVLSLLYGTMLLLNVSQETLAPEIKLCVKVKWK